MNTNKLARQIVLAMLAGILAGYLCNTYARDVQQAKEFAAYFSMGTDIFLRMIKMIIAPLVFSTLVSGIASMGDTQAVGRIGIKALIWFVCAAT
ncbi:MAG TPA: cation:dicarboxylase symporter family transporter, partial [Burkholderiaceae bacterium]